MPLLSAVSSIAAARVFFDHAIELSALVSSVQSRHAHRCATVSQSNMRNSIREPTKIVEHRRQAMSITFVPGSRATGIAGDSEASTAMSRGLYIMLIKHVVSQKPLRLPHHSWPPGPHPPVPHFYHDMSATTSSCQQPFPLSFAISTSVPRYCQRTPSSSGRSHTHPKPCHCSNASCAFSHKSLVKDAVS